MIRDIFNGIKYLLVVFLITIFITIIGFILSTAILWIGILLSILTTICICLVIDKCLIERFVTRNKEENITDGWATEYHGNTRKIKFKIEKLNGKRNGKLIEFYENGKIKFKTYYKDGIQNGETESFYENEMLYESYNLIDGKLNGKLYRYHKNGNLKFECQYMSGVQYGIANTYYENGDIFRTIELDDKSDYVIEKEYYIFGILKFIYKDSRIIYFNKYGEKVSEINFKPNGTYNFRIYEDDMSNFLKTNLPYEEWFDFRRNGKVERIFRFIKEYNPDSNYNIIEIEFLNQSGFVHKKYLLNYKFKKGFHANFISDLAEVRSCSNEFMYRRLIRCKGAPGVSNDIAYTVNFQEIKSVLNFIELQFKTEIEQTEICWDLDL